MTTEGERISRSALHFSYKEVFYKHFPYYLSIGMTPEQYWDGDSELVKYYREADDMRKRRMNEEKWLQGMYIYDALIKLVPVMVAFPKKGAKPGEYPAEPYPFESDREEEAKKAQEEQEKKHMENNRTYMEMFMVANNKRFNEERK